LLKPTRHARNRMRRDEVGLSDVEVCIGNPDFTREQPQGRRESWLRLGQRYLKVVHRREGQDEVVITVIVKRRPPAMAAQEKEE